jgi:hypothetical protein
VPIKRFYQLIFLCAFLAASPDASAQKISVGVIGGLGLTDDFRTETIPAQGFSPYMTFYSASKSYVAGALIEIGLPLHFAVELDALYRPLSYKFTGSYTNPSGVGDFSHPAATVVTWEFPLVAKYKVPFPVVQPFVEAGPSFRSAGNLNGTSPSNRGMTVGAGVEAHFHKIKITPVIRFTRWAPDHLATPWAVTNPNQAEFLVGFSF